MGEVIRQGYLLKLPRHWKVWAVGLKKKYFVLRCGNLPDQYFLDYYNSPTSRQRASLDMESCQQVDAYLNLLDKGRLHQWIFDIKMPNRTYYLVASSEQEMNEWVSDLCTVCKLQREDDVSPDGFDGTMFRTELDPVFPSSLASHQFQPNPHNWPPSFQPQQNGHQDHSSHRNGYLVQHSQDHNNPYGAPSSHPHHHQQHYNHHEPTRVYPPSDDNGDDSYQSGTISPRVEEAIREAVKEKANQNHRNENHSQMLPYYPSSSNVGSSMMPPTPTSSTLSTGGIGYERLTDFISAPPRPKKETPVDENPPLFPRCDSYSSGKNVKVSPSRSQLSSDSPLFVSHARSHSEEAHLRSGDPHSGSPGGFPLPTSSSQNPNQPHPSGLCRYRTSNTDSNLLSVENGVSGSGPVATPSTISLESNPPPRPPRNWSTNPPKTPDSSDVDSHSTCSREMPRHWRSTPKDLGGSSEGDIAPEPLYGSLSRTKAPRQPKPPIPTRTKLASLPQLKDAGGPQSAKLPVISSSIESHDRSIRDNGVSRSTAALNPRLANQTHHTEAPRPPITPSRRTGRAVSAHAGSPPEEPPPVDRSLKPKRSHESTSSGTNAQRREAQPRIPINLVPKQSFKRKPLTSHENGVHRNRNGVLDSNTDSLQYTRIVVPKAPTLEYVDLHPPSPSSSQANTLTSTGGIAGAGFPTAGPPTSALLDYKDIDPRKTKAVERNQMSRENVLFKRSMLSIESEGGSLSPGSPRYGR